MIRHVLILATQLATAWALLAATPAKSADTAPEVYTVLYLVPRTPVIIRVKVDVNGRTLGEVWRDYVEDEFRRLDRDGDGVLRGAETAGVPSVAELTALKLAAPRASAGTPVQPRGEQTRAQFASYLSAACGSPLAVNAIPRAAPTNSESQPDDVGQALFDRLDADHNGRLSAEELQWTASLSRLDRDDDDTLSRDELEPLRSPYFRFSSGTTAPPKPSQAMLYVCSSDVGLSAVRTLIDRYDGADGSPRDQQLSVAELGLSAKTLSEVDNDGSGALDLDELRQWLRAPTPDVELTCRLGSQQEANQGARWASVAGSLRPGLSLQITSRSMVVDRVYLILEPPIQMLDDQRLFSETLFKQLDQDGNGYLDATEVRQSVLADGFRWMDADHDGKVFTKEFTDFVNRRTAAQQARVELTILEQANRLFELFDSNDDGRLTPRELSSAQGSFAKWDLNDDGQLMLSEIPRRWQWQFTRGVASNFGTRMIVAPNGRSQALTKYNPVWFEQMDRNQDGEVTRREFLGPLSSFDRLDHDHNGVLDAGEATLAK